MDENFRDGNIYNYSGAKKQEPQKPTQSSKESMRRYQDFSDVEDGSSIKTEQDLVKQAPLAS